MVDALCDDRSSSSGLVHIGFGSPSGACGAPCNVVWGQWANSTELADQWLRKASTFLCNVWREQEPIDANVSLAIDLVNPITRELEIDAAPVPDKEKLAVSVPSKPGDITYQEVRPIAPGDAPTFNLSSPAFVSPIVPSPLTASLPDTVGDLDYGTEPVSPDYELPAVPTLGSLNIPDAPQTPDVLTFEMVLPSENLNAPQGGFEYVESSYSSDILVQLNAQFLNALQNSSTGLSALAEDTLYQRAVERDASEARKAKQEAMDEFAARGFPLPPGALHGVVQDINQASLDKRGEINREVYLDQTKRAFEYNQFILTNAANWEVALMGVNNQLQQRLMDAQRFSSELGLNQFNADVALYSARIQAYAAYSEAFKAQLESQLIGLQFYRTELDAAKLRGELRMQDVALYEAQLKAVQTVVEIYRTDTQAYSTRIQAEGQKVEVYKAEVDAYGSLVQAKSEEYRGYSSQVQAELAKIQAFTSQVDAYKSEVQAYAALTDAQKAATDSDIAINEQSIRQYAALLDTYKAELQAETTRVSAEAQSFDAEVKAYSANVDGASEQVKLDQTRFQAEAANSFNQAQLRLKQATANVENMQKSLALILDLNKSGADIAAGVGTAAFNSVSTSASVSGSDSSTI